MTDHTRVGHVLGIDLSDKKFDYCLLNADCEIIKEERLPLTRKALLKLLDQAPMRVVFEVGTHSPWVSRLCESLGHETLVANARRLGFIYQSNQKNDRNDAEQLARVGRMDPKMLFPIRHRGARAQADLAQIRSRDELVRMRTALVNHIRGSVKATGDRLPSCSATTFHKAVRDKIPEALAPALEPVFEILSKLTAQIRSLDRAIEEQCEASYPETNCLRQVAGVGALTALSFILVLEDPKHFKKSRNVGPFLGLTPKQDDSGETRKQLRITKAGDQLMRRLLVGSAQYIIGPKGPDSDLRFWGLELAKRGGKNAKKRAACAVARKLGVLLHSLWKTGEVYEPLRHVSRSSARQGQVA